MSYHRGSWFTNAFTPWARNAITAAGILASELQTVEPEGWRLSGSARSSRGPFTFRLTRISDHAEHVVVAGAVADIRSAIERLLDQVQPDSLEAQLAASLAAKGIV